MVCLLLCYVFECNELCVEILQVHEVETLTPEVRCSMKRKQETTDRSVIAVRVTRLFSVSVVIFFGLNGGDQ